MFYSLFLFNSCLENCRKGRGVFMHVSQKKLFLWKFQKNSAKLKICMPLYIKVWMKERNRCTDAKDQKLCESKQHCRSV